MTLSESETVTAGDGKVHLEDYRVGEVFESNARSMTEADLVHYSMFSGDWERRSAPDGRWLVPDMFAFSVGLCLLLGAGRYSWMARSFIAFYGFDEIEMAGGLCVGDTISSTVRVLGLHERDDDRGVIAYLHETTDQDGRVVCSSRHRVLLARCPAEDGR
jgi:acyl dehydratase